MEQYLNSLASRYYKYLLFVFKQNLSLAKDKPLLLSDWTVAIRNYYLKVEDDIYQSKIIQTYKELDNIRTPLPEIIQRIQAIRTELKQQQDFGIEYNQDYYPVSDFVHETEDKAIIRFIIRYGIYLKIYQVVKAAKQELEKPKESFGEKIIKELFAKPIILPTAFKWFGRNPKKQVPHLFDDLAANQFIAGFTDYKIFKLLFEGGRIKEAVQWNGTLGQLVYLFVSLAKASHIEVPVQFDEFIQNDDWEAKEKQALSKWLFEKLVYCFTDKRGNPFTHTQLKDAKKYYEHIKDVHKPERGELIDAIVKALSALNN